MNMQQLLQKIVAGETNFEPSGSSERELHEFQVIATLILKAEEQGYVTDVLFHRESSSGNDYYDAVVVGGITDRGRDAAG